MKKLISVMMLMVFCFSSFAAVQAEETGNTDYEITSDGEITAYYGGEWVVVPEKVNEIPVVKIGEQAFFDLGITDVVLPEGVSVIGKSAFEGCNTTSVELPSTVSIIGERAFANCAELYTVITSFDENTVIGKDAFLGTGDLLFYIDCDVDIDKLYYKILEAKNDDRFEYVLRHEDGGYDEHGNMVCSICGFVEGSDVELLPFEDVPVDGWYYNAVQIAYTNRIINGKSETIFDPDAGMTCAEAAKIAASIRSIYFEEIPEYTEGPWYQPYVDYCYQYGMIEDYISFDWDAPITRGQMAYIFSHCDPYEEWYENPNDVPITDIPDVYDTTPYAYEILDLYNKGIAVGDENMAFHPDANIKRCEAAAIVSRIMDWTTRIELPKG
ncbi:MAG: S-layer homology domain-containing protein [Clostridia bacterium]|nr:S-layer homology domain-containing protein [Clostridia bacterium]